MYGFHVTVLIEILIHLVFLFRFQKRFYYILLSLNLQQSHFLFTLSLPLLVAVFYENLFEQLLFLHSLD